MRKAITAKRVEEKINFSSCPTFCNRDKLTFCKTEK